MMAVRPFAHTLRFIVAATLFATLLVITPARAAGWTMSLVVNTTADVVHDSAGNSCVPVGNTCSLRDAVLYGNVHNVDTAITLPSGVYRLTITPAGSDDASTGDLNLTNNVTITGAGASATTIDGSAITDGIFTVASNTVTFSGLTINGGLRSTGAAPSGGALLLQGGSVVVSDCVFSNNAVRGLAGALAGGAHFGGSAYGGAIYNSGGLLDVRRSTFANNTATGGAGDTGGKPGGGASGGAIASDSGAVFTSIANSTFTNNGAHGGFGGDGNVSSLAGGTGGDGTGGALFLDGTNIPGSITGSTFAGNSATGATGGNGEDTGQIGTGGAGGRGGRGAGGAVSTGFTAAFSVNISNSTFVSNTATSGNGGNGGPGAPMGPGGAAGAADGGALSLELTGNTITNVTIDSNNATGGIGGTGGGGTHGAPGTHTGGGISIVDGSTQVANTIVSNNGASGNCAFPNSSTALTNTARNLQFNPNSGCGSDTPFAVGDPKLGPLTYNGGPTKTRELLPGSAAIDVGNDTYCAGDPVLNLDQRGFPRPQGSHCDIGAFEVAHPNAAPTPKAAAATIAGQPVAPRPNPAHAIAPTPLPFTPTPQPQPGRR